MFNPVIYGVFHLRRPRSTKLQHSTVVLSSQSFRQKQSATRHQESNNRTQAPQKVQVRSDGSDVVSRNRKLLEGFPTEFTLGEEITSFVSVSTGGGENRSQIRLEH